MAVTHIPNATLPASPHFNDRFPAQPKMLAMSIRKEEAPVQTEIVDKVDVAIRETETHFRPFLDALNDGLDDLDQNYMNDLEIDEV